MSWAAGTAGWKAKLALTRASLSFEAAASAACLQRDKGICNAKQSSSSQKRTVIGRRGGGGGWAGQKRNQPHPPRTLSARQTRYWGGWTAEHARECCRNLWLASSEEEKEERGSKSYDSLSGQLGARCLAPSPLLSPSRPNSAGLLPAGSLQKQEENGPTVGCVCSRPRGAEEQTPPQVSIWSVTSRWVPRTANFPQAQTSQITQSCLVQTCPRHA